MWQCSIACGESRIGLMSTGVFEALWIVKLLLWLFIALPAPDPALAEKLR